MESVIERKPMLFRLNEHLVERLRELARIEHRSLNRFVEDILFDFVEKDPKDLTLEAIEEVRSGKLKNATPIDTSSVEAMFKSAGL